MALSQCHSLLQFPNCCGSSFSYNSKSNSPSPSVKSKFSSLQIRTTNTPFLGALFPSNNSIWIPHRRSRSGRQLDLGLRAAENDSEESITTAATTSEVEEETSKRSSSDNALKGEEGLSDIGNELKKMMKEKSGEKRADLSWGAVIEEIGQIEWPEFQKVVGTTAVVLAVIAGSSVVLLSVNAVLAELSDSLFAGRGIQDFFR